MARRAWAAFSAALVRRPLLTNMGVSGCTMSVGDLTAQAVEMRQRGEPFRFSSFKIDRTAIAIGWNTLLFTPIFLVWFRRLDRLFPGTGLAQALKKVTVNQLIITVPINAGFLAYTTTVETVLRSPEKHANMWDAFDGHSIVERVEMQFRNDLKDIFQRSCQFWFPVNFLNFLFVPQTHRVLPTIFASTCWSVYLSLTAHKHGDVRRAP